MYLLDKWGHKLHLPSLVQDPICNALDWWLTERMADERIPLPNARADGES